MIDEKFLLARTTHPDEQKVGPARRNMLCYLTLFPTWEVTIPRSYDPNLWMLGFNPGARRV
jgi:hypothetical protein